MKTPSNIAFVVTLLLISFSYALGQEEERVKVGDRVRVLTPVSVISSRGGEKHENSWFEGTLDSLDADALILKLEDQNARLVVPLASLKRLEVCRNRKSRTLAGASLGFLGGAIAGAMIGYAADEQGNDVAPEHAALLGAAPGAGLGVLIGAGIGSAMADERWQEVPLAEIRMNMTPNGHEGFAVFKSLAH